MTAYIGTSGWQYAHWKETFYPKGLGQPRWLDFYFQRFQTVELNVTFYRLPKAETFAKWRQKTPSDFIFAVKMSRYLTHIKRLKDPAPSIEYFMSKARELGPKMGPILIQLPPTMKVDAPALDDALAHLPGRRVAVEFRHETWWTDEVRSVLEKHGAALCMADRWARPVTELWKTTDWTFLRFHQGDGRPHPCYRKASLEPWVERLADSWGPEADSYIYFNNDPRACALRDAIWFHDMLADAGFETTRVPRRSDVRVADVDSAAWATSS